MMVLGRRQGEKIEIEATALVRVARVEADRVRLDVTAPFTRSRAAESEVEGAAGPAAIVKVLSIAPGPALGELRVRLGVRAPKGTAVRRAEVPQPGQRRPRFPWNRFQPTARYWRSIGEEIHIHLS